MRKYSADFIFPVSSEPIKSGVIVTDEKGKILKIDSRENHDEADLEIYPGVIVPGFINAHCHLELSHMKGVASTGTGLLPFLHTVVNYRDVSQEQIDEAIARADNEMYDAGIVAVGDISNKTDTAIVKKQSKIRYYTFVEMFDFLKDDWAQKTFDDYYKVFEQQPSENGHRKSCVPHAPYTVSKKLFRLINEANRSNEPLTISIHNQETPYEDEFFLTKTGDFLRFYEDFRIPVEEFQPTGKQSIYYALEHLDPGHRILFVHNTMTKPNEIYAALNWSANAGESGNKNQESRIKNQETIANSQQPTANSQPPTTNCFWATCPNANLYIENQLPNYRHFIETGAKVCIGTDSLTSNWQLSVLEEMKTIARFQSYVPFETLLRWATLNGAEALGFDNEIGSLDTGKTPGLNLLSLGPDFKLNPQTTVKRLI